MRQILVILGIAAILASCTGGQKCRSSGGPAYNLCEAEESPAPVKRHNRW